MILGNRQSDIGRIRSCLSLAGALLVTAATSAPLRAAPSNSDLHNEVKALQAELRDLQTAIDKSRQATRRASAMLRAAPRPVPAAAPPAAFPQLPAGATPAFITADKGLKFGSITITPGGFFAAESVFRARTTQSDMDTNFASIPFGNSPLAHANEFRFSSRQTRIALLAEADPTPTLVTAGYLEIDFRAAANTANFNEANGFNPRIRNLYATLDETSYGVHVLAGQNWSLAVLNSKGITPRNEVTPGVIEGKYVPGFVSPRQPGIRLTKDLFNEKLWLSLAAEQPQTTFSTACAAGSNAPATFGITGNFDGSNTLTGITCSANGTGGGLGNQPNPFSLNHVPDVIGKAAYELLIGQRDIHFEAFGLYRDFYDRVAYTDTQGIARNTNHDTPGYGVGAGIIVPIIPRKLDFQASGLFGRGIGRYGTSQLSETVFNPNGSLSPIREGMLLGGVVIHATPAIDVYGYAGIERQFRDYNSSGVTATPFYGLGAPVANGIADTSSGCGLEPNAVAQVAGAAAANPCVGNTKQVFQLTGGMWDNLYRGSFGQLRVGVQYSFTERQIFNTIPGVPNATLNNYQPKAFDNMVFTSVRYFPFY